MREEDNLMLNIDDEFAKYGDVCYICTCKTSQDIECIEYKNCDELHLNGYTSLNRQCLTKLECLGIYY